jgi:hypothetical protein
MSEYYTVYGDPRTNNYNHTYYCLDQKPGYLVPVSTRAKIKRQKRMGVENRSVVDSNKEIQLTTDQMDRSYEDVKNSFFGMLKSTGTTQQQLAREQQRSSSSTQDAPPQLHMLPGLAAGTPQGIAPQNDAAVSSYGVSGFGPAFGGFGCAGGVGTCANSFFGLQSHPQNGVGGSAPAEVTTDNITNKKRRGSQKKVLAGGLVKVASPATPAARISTTTPDRTSSHSPSGMGAAPMTAASAAAAAASRTVGRPSRDLPPIVETTCAAVLAAGEGESLHFGQGWITKNKSMKRLLKSIQDKKKVTDNSAEHAALTLADKRLGIVIDVLGEYHCSGLHSNQFEELWNRMQVFGAMTPSVEWPLPIWLGRLMKERKIQMCETPKAFWKCTSSAELAQAGYEDSAFLDVQLRAGLEKVVSLTKDASTAEADLQLFFPSHVLNDYELEVLIILYYIYIYIYIYIGPD